MAEVNGGKELPKLSAAQLKSLSPKQVRDEFRRNSGALQRTSEVCFGYLQMNIVCLPSSYADDFEKLCHSNSAPFPLAYRSQPGEVTTPCLAENFDIRTDVGGYGVFEKQNYLGNQDDLLKFPPWDDMVTFYYGCSFSLSAIAESAGVSFRYMAERKDVPLFMSNIPLVPAGVFNDANMVVSMRPCKKSLVEDLVQAVGPYEVVHGCPIHIGDPSIIGIHDLSERFFGSLLDLNNDEVPVFWGCGVSAKQALHNAKIDGNWITHHETSCNYLMVTDIKADDYLANHKPSFGDQKPKVIELSEKPDFMSLLSDKTLEEISKLDNTKHDGNLNEIYTVGQGTLVNVTLMLSHSSTVVIETTLPENNKPWRNNGVSLAKILLGLGKNVIIYLKNDNGLLSNVEEEFQKAIDKEMLCRLEFVKYSQVTMVTESSTSGAIHSIFKIIVSQNQDSLENVKQLSKLVKGTALDLSHWGYDVTSKALEYLQSCVIHSRYRCHGVGDWAQGCSN